MSGFEGQCSKYDEIRERRSDVENSEDERRRFKIGTLKKKAMNASSKLTHSLKKRGKKKIDCRVPAVSIEDVRDASEEIAVYELREKLIERGSLPPRHDDYHTLLRFLKATNFNIEKTIQMWEAMLAWRKEFRTDTILESPQSSGQEFDPCCTYCVCASEPNGSCITGEFRYKTTLEVPPPNC